MVDRQQGEGRRASVVEGTSAGKKASPGDTAERSDTPQTSQGPQEQGGLGDSASREAMNPSDHRPAVARWGIAVLVGLIVAMPLAWLLSFAGMLPGFLGLFFFALFGVVIGATVHRVAAPGRPYNKWVVLAGTTVVVLVTWLVAIGIESRDFPRGVAIRAGNQTRNIGDQTIEEFRAAVAADVGRFLRERHPPGGVIGYTRWMLLSGELQAEQIAGLGRPIRLSQRRYTFAIRVVLSIALLAYGVSSQTFLLKRVQDERVAEDDGQPGTSSG